jgi:type IV secretion system protein VirB6
MVALLAQEIPEIPGMKLFVELDDVISKALDAFVSPTAANVIGVLQMVALLGATIYIMFIGFTIVFGADSTPVYTFFSKTAKIILVTAFALSADRYLGGLVAALNGLEDGLVSAIAMGENKINGNIFEVLDKTLGRGFFLAQGAFQQAEQAGPLSPGAALGWAATGLILGGSTILIVTVGGAAVLLSKFALAILFGLGPFFVLCLMFPQTAGFFDKWLSQVLSFVFQNVIIAAIFMLAINTFTRFLVGVFIQGKGGPNPIVAALQIAALSVVYTYLILKAGPLASGLSGGAAASLIDARQAAMGTARAVAGGAVAAAMLGGAAAATGRGVAGATQAAAQGIGRASGAAVLGVSGAARHAAHGLGRVGRSAGKSLSSALGGLRGEGSPSSPTGLAGGNGRKGVGGARAAAISSFAARTALATLLHAEKPSSSPSPERKLGKSKA